MLPCIYKVLIPLRITSQEKHERGGTAAAHYQQICFVLTRVILCKIMPPLSSTSLSDTGTRLQQPMAGQKYNNIMLLRI